MKRNGRDTRTEEVLVELHWSGGRERREATLDQTFVFRFLEIFGHLLDVFDFA